MSGKLQLDPVTVRKARSLARQAGRPIVNLAKQHTTVSVERATLRLAGLQGADADGIPWVNRLLDSVRGDVGLEHGIALPVWDALVRGEADDLSTLAQKASAGSVRFRLPEGKDPDEVVRDEPDRWREEVRTAQPIVEYLVDTYAKRHDPRTLAGREKVSARRKSCSWPDDSSWGKRSSRCAMPRRSSRARLRSSDVAGSPPHVESMSTRWSTSVRSR